MKIKYSIKAILLLIFFGNSLSGWSQTDHERLISWLQSWQAAPLIEVNWGTAEDLASCTGVTAIEIDGVERLQGLSLPGHGIFASLPNDLGAFAYLEELDLSQNYLHGSLPPGLEELNQLRVLNLESNQLTGTLSSGLGNLVSLEELKLMKNNFMGSIPNTLSDLTGLSVLELGNNSITGPLPQNVGDLVNLEILNLSYMGIEGNLPSTLGKLSNLTELILDGSAKLSGPIPPTLKNIPALQILHYGNTGLCTPTTTAFLDWLATVPNVLGNEGFCDCLDVDRYALSQLAAQTNWEGWANSTNWTSAQPLDQWHGVTTSEEGCVIRLELPANNMVGGLPEITFYMENLQVLDLSNNSLSGQLPQAVHIPFGLQHINLENNGLSGGLPTELGDLAVLQHLNLSDNGFSGSIPANLKSPMVLNHLDLGNNGFSGAIPESLSSLSNLEHLDLGHNNLIQGVPASLGGLLELTALDLSHNLLDGELPEALNSLSALNNLYLNNNWGLVGEVPVNFTALGELNSFHFHNTQLCEPDDTDFQTWITAIPDLMSTGVSCCGPGWEQTQKVSPINDARQFGISADITGNQAIVGANGSSGSKLGSAHVYAYNGVDWQLEGLLESNDGKPLDHFGISVAISGDYAIVGAEKNNPNGPNSGAAYIFKKEGGVWTQEQKLIPNDGSPNAYFGKSVDIDGAYAVVGAYHAKENNVTVGGAYVFKRTEIGNKSKSYYQICLPLPILDILWLSMGIKLW